MKSRGTTMWLRVCIFLTLALSTDSKSCPPCTIKLDTMYNGSLVDCSNSYLKSINASQFPQDTTTLIMAGSDLGHLPAGTFLGMKKLRYLDLRRCSLNSIEADTFQELQVLSVLLLERNSLAFCNYAFPKGVFRPMPNLLTLGLSGNVKSFSATCKKGINYTEFLDFFDYLTDLEYLSIDAVANISFGPEMEKLHKLTTLNVMVLGPSHIGNNSFKYVGNPQLKNFKMQQTYLHIRCESNPFQHLAKNMRVFILQKVRMGNQLVGMAMRPFRNSRITTLTFDETRLSDFETMGKRVLDGYISKNTMRHILQICVTHFSWTRSHIFAVTYDSFYSSTWRNCLRSIDLSLNDIAVIDHSVSFYLLRLRVENLTLTLDSKSETRAIAQKTSLKIIHKKELLSQRNKGIIQTGDRIGNNKMSTGKIKSQDGLINKTTSLTPEGKDGEPVIKSSKPRRHWLGSDQPSIYKRIKRRSDERVNLFVPKSLRILTIHAFNRISVFHIRRNISLHGFNLKEFHVTDCTPVSVEAQLQILHGASLKVLNFSRTVNNVEPRMFPNLETLDLQATQADPNFLHQHSEHFLRYNKVLKHLDLSRNNLMSLAKDTFRKNRNLSTINLANNRFTHIPFNLAFTPKLEVLDLRWNGLLYLDAHDRRMIDDHLAVQKRFQIKLEGNPFRCRCMDLAFLVWLHTSEVIFDGNGEFACINQDGDNTTTGYMTDIEALWRQCVGKTSFFVSLIVSFFMIMSMLALFLVRKYRLTIIGFIMQKLVPGFRLTTPRDYKYDVFIGYETGEIAFVKNTLLRLLEDDLGLRTFVHDRDLLQDQLVLFDAIKDSWRTLLVVTDTFVNHYPLAHRIMQSSTFFVSPSNPGRVVVLAQSVQLIPQYVLEVVDDTQIIILQDLTRPINPDQRLAIRDKILYRP